MGKFKRNFKKYICLSMCMALILTTVFVGTAASADNIEYYRSAKVWKGGDNGDTISVSDYALLDGEGNSVTGSESEFSSDYINALKKDLGTGDVKAKKTVLFANEADKTNGYLKTNFDIVGNTAQENKPKDVLFVSTVSSSAAMFSRMSGVIPQICPCMNTDHYYRVPKDFVAHDYSDSSHTTSMATIENKTGRDLYFNIKDVCGEESFWDFSSITVGMINNYFYATYGEQLTVTGQNAAEASTKSSNVVGKFWKMLIAGIDDGANSEYSGYLNHYAPTDTAATADNGINENALIWYKSADGSSYTPKVTNMRPAAYDLHKKWREKNQWLTYGSPDLDNGDGCLDRMMASKKMIKSFANDLLENNTTGAENNNRVALINYAGFANRGSTVGVDNNNNIVRKTSGDAQTHYPIVKFADFTDEKNDAAFNETVNSLKAYAGIDYAAAMYAANQVMIDEKYVDTTYTKDEYTNINATSATLDPDKLSKGYIWVGEDFTRRSNARGDNAHIYSLTDKKYWPTPDITRVKGSRSNAEKIVIFIVDSMPADVNGITAINKAMEALEKDSSKNNAGGKLIGSMMYYNYEFDDSLKALKQNAAIYTTGFMVTNGEYNVFHSFENDGIPTSGSKVRARTILKGMASGTTDEEKTKYFKNAQNTEEFRNFLNVIKGELLKTPCKSVSDSLGNNYSFVCDETHPISVITGPNGTPVTYNSLTDAVQSGYFSLSADKKTITWNGGDVSKGVRISFYSKLDDEYLFPKTASAEVKEYPTNSAQTLVYTKTVSETEETINGVVEYAGYKLSVKSGTAKVELSRAPAGDVRKGGEITYTLSLVKSGAIDLNGVTVTAVTPENTTLKDGNTEPNKEKITTGAALNYSVTVNSGENVQLETTVIENVAHFTIDKTANRIPDAVDLSIDNINTNTVKNKVSANGTIAITAPNKKLSSDKTQAYIYKVTKTGTDGNEVRVATVMVAAGKTEVVSGLVTGAYKVAEITDWAWRYKNAESTKERTVTITGDELDIAAEFSKDSQSGGPLSGHSSKWSNKYGVDGGVSING